jgi:hypothetical protein
MIIIIGLLLLLLLCFVALVYICVNPTAALECLQKRRDSIRTIALARGVGIVHEKAGVQQQAVTASELPVPDVRIPSSVFTQEVEGGSTRI